MSSNQSFNRATNPFTAEAEIANGTSVRDHPCAREIGG
jgi:hypothetical protein